MRIGFAAAKGANVTAEEHCGVADSSNSRRTCLPMGFVETMVNSGDANLVLVEGTTNGVEAKPNGAANDTEVGMT